MLIQRCQNVQALFNAQGKVLFTGARRDVHNARALALGDLIPDDDPVLDALLSR